ncbi:hypothetical protein P154DRAFT_488607 [Amniculicola lignicola CBS 123094]|uniref:Zn(2)-C6 fungal-type domain-containing protein n=1 Tax=Amniculicola lignicola CBS 123094 TaxID=1392246 RepID=A0A6A5WNS7_9PLEO|nr:hypothetical protein P154DRAFT_488607 [Amniculicola lignicola CBS 123094]
MDDVKKAANEARRRARKSRSRGLRRTTGCLTCRRRHVKCDEAVPACERCKKCQQICIYTPVTEESSVSSVPTLEATAPKHDTEGSGNVQSGAVTSDNQSLSPRDRSPSESWQPPYRDQDSERAAGLLLDLNTGDPYASFSVENAVYSSASVVCTQSYIEDYSDATNHAGLTPPDVAFHRWFGLLANDAAQQDTLWRSRMNTPDSTGQYFPLVSSRSDTLLVDPLLDTTPIASSPALGKTQSIKKVSWRGTEPAKLSHHEDVLFQNFVHNVSGWIDLHDSTRCFSVTVPHLALHDAGLMNAILALSARQLSINPDTPVEQRDRQSGLQYYFETLRYLQKALHYEAYTVSLELLSTALIVSTYEMLDDHGSGWERHLEGVFWIQRSQVIHGESGGLKQAVWWAWLRQDVWAAYRERRPTLSFWKPNQALSGMTPYELARRSVWIFAKAVDYCSKEEIESGKVNIHARITRADFLFSILDEWLDSLGSEFDSMPRQSGDSVDIFQPIWIHPPAFSVSVQLHYSARILILLHKPSLGGLQNHRIQQRQLTEAVKKICGIALTLTDAASSLVSSQCLYIAGLCMEHESERKEILSLLDCCHRTTGWPTQSLSGELKKE